MTIVFRDRFTESLDAILDYIAQDSLSRALNFSRQLHKQIMTLPQMPYRYRQSHYYDNPNIRDMIFKGYTIPYFVDGDTIALLDIFKWTDR